MIKRILAIVAIAAVFAACTPSDGSGTSPDMSPMSSEAPSLSIESAPASP